EDDAHAAGRRRLEEVLDVEVPDILGGNADAGVHAGRVVERAADGRGTEGGDVGRARVLLDGGLARGLAAARPPVEQRRAGHADVAGGDEDRLPLGRAALVVVV